MGLRFTDRRRALAARHVATTSSFEGPCGPSGRPRATHRQAASDSTSPEPDAVVLATRSRRRARTRTRQHGRTHVRRGRLHHRLRDHWCLGCVPPREGRRPRRRAGREYQRGRARGARLLCAPFFVRSPLVLTSFGGRRLWRDRCVARSSLSCCRRTHSMQAGTAGISPRTRMATSAPSKGHTGATRRCAQSKSSGTPLARFTGS